MKEGGQGLLGERGRFGALGLMSGKLRPLLSLPEPQDQPAILQVRNLKSSSHRVKVKAGWGKVRWPDLPGLPHSGATPPPCPHPPAKASVGSGTLDLALCWAAAT